MSSTSSQTDSGLQTSARSSDFPAAEGLAHYRLGRPIGQGGMGVVHLALDRVSGRPCAVKTMRRELESDPANAARFQKEIDLLARFSHPNIVRLLDGGRAANESRSFVMEYVPGQNLDEYVREHGPLSSQSVLNILRRICSALGAVHSKGIVHRDIKPANIIAAETDGSPIDVKLVDFGLCQSAARQSRGCGPAAGESFAGSLLYASPESYSGQVDGRSDLYSLGATAYHLLTGRPVFDERRPAAAMMAHASREPISLRHLCGETDPTLEAIVMKCLRKDPSERFQSIAELEFALAGVALAPSRRRNARSSQVTASRRGNRRTANERTVIAPHLV